ncbi:PDZ domain-containing protein [Erythrobacter litoralis]|uniref:Uncharacterized protein n=1 Tax=Erythrobacter litoralis (strain HTCC2594) TaxID=314225 RepID=Q2N6S0_ERYLH|nr:PDZ domain-containing protein [Erythrobacter litoralis]ABC64621.1 hypothetical protein ELI_12645 [Erythrobacter litoralis HTCC2594]
MIRFLVGLGLAAGCAASASAWAPPADFLELRAKDARVARIGFELATANAPFCDDKVPATGLLLHDMGAYADPQQMRSALGLTSDIAVQAVVPDSPAAEAGLATDDSIVSFDNVPVSALPSDENKRWFRLERLRQTMTEQLAESGTVSLALQGDEAITLRGVAACRSRFEVGPLGKRAVANGERVVIGDKFPGHEWPDELLAAVMAHELAHNVLRHRAWFDANGRQRKYVRLTEREADRLMPWLLANAGYEPSAAARFMETWGPAHSGGIFRKRTHDGWDERADMIAAEVALVEARLAAGEQADWKTHFRREDLPNR